MSEQEQSYPKDFVRNAIFKLNYSPILSIEVTKPVDFQSKIIEKFPKMKQITAHSVDIGLPGNESSANVRPFSIWHFFDKNETKVIALEPHAITIEIKRYISFEEFKECIQVVLDAFFDIYKPVINRVGLRYIRILENLGSSSDLNKYLHDDLLTGMDFYREKSEIARFMHTIHINKEENMIRFNYGFANTKNYPNAITDSEFVLDYDCYAQNVNIDDKSEILKMLEDYYSQINDLFKSSIKEPLKILMSKKGESENEEK